MRVLLINSLYEPFGRGGAEASVLELACGLAAMGVRVAVVTLAPKSSRTTAAEAGDGIESIRVFRWETKAADALIGAEGTGAPARKLWWHLLESFRGDARSFVREAIAEFRPDIVHSNNIAGFGSAIFTELVKLPWVHTIRDYYMVCPKTTRFKDGRRCVNSCWSCRALTMPRRASFSAPDAVIGVSNSVLNFHHAQGVWRNVPAQVIRNMPQVGRLQPRTINRIARVGFLGRIDERKGVAVLLEAMGLLRATSLDLILAGSIAPEFAEKYLALSRDRRATHVGQMRVEKFLDLVDLVVIPSQWDEPFGRVASEAVQAGLPVLASRRGGLPEAVEGGRMVELIDDVDNPQVWAEAIERAVTGWTDFDTPAPIASSTVNPTRSYLELYELVITGRPDQTFA